MRAQTNAVQFTIAPKQRAKLTQNNNLSLSLSLLFLLPLLLCWGGDWN